MINAYTEENKRRGKTRHILKKIRDTKGTIHANIGTIKDSNGVDLIEVEDIKKRTKRYRRSKQKIS